MPPAMNAPTLDGPTPTGSQEADRSSPDSLLAGRYQLLAPLGEGGMGTVFLAEDRLLGRQVAVKRLRADLSSHGALVTRFFTEARATARLNHPGIVDVYDFGTDAAGQSFLVMERLEGETLRARLDRVGRLRWPEAIAIARATAAALAAAHRAGIVHRDIKPENIFLLAEENADATAVKLLDFGVAKLRRDGLGSELTHAGVILGTPLFMAPEQCRDAALVDERADIYALGCVLFAMICGRPPFSYASASEVMGAHLYERPGAARAFAPEIPRALDALLVHLLAKEPARRPREMGQVLAALEAMAVPPPVSAGVDAGLPPDRPEPPEMTAAGDSNANVAAPPARRPRRRYLLAAASLLAAAGASGVVALRLRTPAAPAATATPVGAPVITTVRQRYTQRHSVDMPTKRASAPKGYAAAPPNRALEAEIAPRVNQGLSALFGGGVSASVTCRGGICRIVVPDAWARGEGRRWEERLSLTLLQGRIEQWSLTAPNEVYLTFLPEGVRSGESFIAETARLGVPGDLETSCHSRHGGVGDFGITVSLLDAAQAKGDRVRLSTSGSLRGSAYARCVLTAYERAFAGAAPSALVRPGKQSFHYTWRPPERR